MSKLTSIVIAVAMVAGCRDKSKEKPTAAGSAATATGSAAPAGAADPKLIEKLPSVAAGDTALLLNYTIGVVKLGADGTLAVAESPRAAAADPRAPGDPFTAAKPVQLAGLGEALGLPPVTKRSESAYGVSDGAGSAEGGNPNDVAFAALGHPVTASGAPAPAVRQTSAFSLAHPNDVSGGVVVFADASAKAAALVGVLAQTGGFLAVRGPKGLGALPIALDRHAPAPVAPNRPWVEVRVGANGGAIDVERVPSTPVTVAAADKLGEAVKGLGVNAVDVLVGPTTTVQELVAVVEQLQGAGIIAIGFGLAPDAEPQKAARGQLGPRVIAWDFFLHDVAKTTPEPFRAALDATFEPMRVCYRDALAKTADLAGTAQLEIFVAANAKVAAANATGVPPVLGTCIQTALKAAAFPQPSSAGARITAKLAFMPR